MDQKYGEFVGVDNLHYALITDDSASAYAVGAPTYLAPTAEIAGEPEISNKTTYYDNKAANNYVTEGKTELSIVVSGIPAELAATLLGKDFDAATGRVYDAGQANPPNVAIGFRYNKGASQYRYYWYLKGTFSGGTEEAATKTNDVDEKTYTMTFTAVTTTYEWTIGGESKSLKRVFADTTDAAFDPTGWFTQVQTPDAVGSPSALALSTSDPLDDAVDVLVTASPTLTFNNAVESYAISLVKTSDMSLVTATYSLDATSKILTVDPAVDLSASTEYAIIASKVTDIYGQDLENTIITFTTAA